MPSGASDKVIPYAAFSSTSLCKTGTILYKSIMPLAYADDVDIIGRSICEGEAAFSKFAEEARSIGLAVNESETKFLLSTAKDTRILLLLYGAETWTLTSSDEQALGVFERKILRTIYGPFCDRGEWRIRWNQELYDIYDDIVLKYNSVFDGWVMSLVWIAATQVVDVTDKDGLPSVVPNRLIRI